MRRTLDDLTVVDLTQVVSGAVATMFLAEAGADVIKVEPPGGEAYRRAGHSISNERGETNLNIMRFSRHKRSVGIDLKSPPGQEVLAGLLADADVLVENFRPGVLARLGFDRERLEEINPELIYTTVSGFGHDDLQPSLYRDHPTYAIVAEAMAGLMHLAGDGRGTPVWMGFAMADIFAGTLAFAGTLLALADRAQQRPGRRVDVAMYDGALLMNDLAIATHSVLGEVMGPGQYSLQSPWGPFPTTDGHVVIAVLNDRQWSALCELTGHPHLATDPRLRDGRGRSAHHEELVAPVLSAWTRPQPKQVVTDALLAAGIPSAPVRTAEDISHCPQTRARKMLVKVEDPVVGPVELVGNPIKLAGDEADAEGPRIPRLGEHTHEVLRERLGLGEEELQRLVDAGAIYGRLPG